LRPLPADRVVLGTDESEVFEVPHVVFLSRDLRRFANGLTLGDS
jgi:hypothetical protein